MEYDNKPVHERRFDAAVKVIQSLPPDGSFQPSNDMMLKFYSFYKQATQGPCTIPRPGFWDPVGKLKWDAWNSLGDMPREKAMTSYVDEMKLILESMPVTDEVEELLRVLGPFYEVVDEKKRINQVSDLNPGFGGMLSSTPSRSVTKTIIRDLMTMGVLEDRPELQKNVTNEEEEEDDDDDEEVEVENDPEPVKRGGSGKQTEGLANGSLTNGNHSSKMVLTNGTHISKSALDYDDLGEESAGSTYPHVNGYDYPEEGSSLHQLASDSDSEVYCDSMDQFGLEESSEVNITPLDTGDESHSHLSSQEEREEVERTLEDLCDGPGGVQCVPDGVQCGGEEGSAQAPQRPRLTTDRPTDRPDRSVGSRGRGSRLEAPDSGAPGVQQGVGGDGDGEGSEDRPGESLNEQIMVVLSRLQEDMQSVLERLHTLEALTASQTRAMALPSNFPEFPVNKRQKKPSWWPFSMSAGTVAFAVVWPFVVQWLIRLYLQRRRRRIH